ncbi:MAG: LysR family transcriptional regulator, partial [Xanthomonadales bacterium]|nr:LysR family transcriptional regulator [Xanthomonadales bacterium]
HYQVAMHLAELRDLIITLPTRAASLMADHPEVILLPPPFSIPDIELQMAWSPLLQHNPAHQWLRRLIADVAKEMD